MSISCAKWTLNWTSAPSGHCEIVGQVVPLRDSPREKRRSIAVLFCHNIADAVVTCWLLGYSSADNWFWWIYIKLSLLINANMLKFLTRDATLHTTLYAIWQLHCLSTLWNIYPQVTEVESGSTSAIMRTPFQWWHADFNNCMQNVSCYVAPCVKALINLTHLPIANPIAQISHTIKKTFFKYFKSVYILQRLLYVVCLCFKGIVETYINKLGKKMRDPILYIFHLLWQNIPQICTLCLLL